jgi:hypothetical protein
MFDRLPLGEQGIRRLTEEAYSLFYRPSDDQHEENIFESQEMHVTQKSGLTPKQDAWLEDLCHFVANPQFKDSISPELLDYLIDFSRLLPIQERLPFYAAFGNEWLNNQIVGPRFDKCLQVLLREHRPHFLDLFPVETLRANYHTNTAIIFTLMKLNPEDKEPFLRKLGMNHLKENVTDNKAMSLLLNYLPVEIRSDFFREMIDGDAVYRKKIVPTKDDVRLMMDKCSYNRFPMFHSMGAMPAVRDEDLRSSMRKMV